MAHEIEIVNGRASAMYVGKAAWHGLGVLLNNPPTTGEALRLAGLDWTAVKEPAFLADGTEIPDTFAVVRSTDRKILGSVGGNFHVLQNANAMGRFQPLIDSGLVTIEAAGSLRGGKRIWILCKLKGPDGVIVAKSDDRVERYLLLAHGHDGSLSIFLGVTPTRVVCANTLSVALGDGRDSMLRIKHTKNSDASLDAAFEVIKRANAQFDKAVEAYRALASVNVKSAEQMRAYIDIVFPPAKKAEKPAPVSAPVVDGAGLMASLLNRPIGEARESMFSADVGEATKETRTRIYGEIEALFQRGRGNDLAGVKGTAWAAYNAVTEYITHERGRNADNRVNTAWFGAESARALQGAMSTFVGGN